MGLLDSFLPEDEQKKAAMKMGLLQFGAQMMANANQGFGGAMGAGLLSGADGYQSTLKNGIDMKQKQQKADWTARMMGEMQGGSSGSSGAQDGDSNGAMFPQARRGPSLDTLQKGALLGMPGMDTLFNMHKYENDGIERKPGTTYRNPITGAEEYIQEPKSGMIWNAATQSVKPIGGFNENAATQEAMKTEAVERVKAGYTPLDPTKFVASDGAPVGGSVLNYLQPQKPQSGPSTPSNFPSISPAVQQGRDSEARALIQAEFDNATNPADKASLGRELSRMGAPKLQSEAQREAAVGRVRMQNSVDEKRMVSEQERSGKDKRLYEQLGAAIPMARRHLSDATGSGAGALADKTMAFFGKSTKGAESAQALDTISGWMVSNVPRMEGPQSNVDVINYQTMAGRVADRNLPNEVRLQALDTLEELQKKYAVLNGTASADKKAPNLMDDLPKANTSNKGKIAIDHETGKRYKSNGLQWVEAK